ncbi:hypothetical protein [Xenorhabdus mauleonii]|uniref:hypothetical protein n=1 Tax=Xenorhabdus mauleonii TaxID=351675 RepID=UPI001B80339C
MRDKARNAVPSGRRVNGKPLAGDISLTAADVGAYSRGETYSRGEMEGRIAEVKAVASHTMGGMRISAIRRNGNGGLVAIGGTPGPFGSTRGGTKIDDSGRLKGEVLLNIVTHTTNNASKIQQRHYAVIQYLMNGAWVTIAEDDFMTSDLNTSHYERGSSGRH